MTHHVWGLTKEGSGGEIYLDHAATSFPKPREVVEAVVHALENLAAPGRGNSPRAQKAAVLMEETRALAARVLGVEASSCISFTKSATEAINCAVKGYLTPGDVVVTTSMEHNAVARPLARLADQWKIIVRRIPCSPDGALDWEAFERILEAEPKLVVLPHASNVNGALFPVDTIAARCRETNIPVLLDAAQTAGLQPLHAASWHLGMLACSGHKGLLGPSGIGLLYVRPDLYVAPLLEGGTGSRSEEWTQPDEVPDRFESGTPNIPGIAGLKAGMEWILLRGVHDTGRREIQLAQSLEDGLEAIPDVTVYRPHRRGGNAVSFRIQGLNPQDVGALLGQAGFAVRTGLHCAPLAHQTLGTYPEGTVRAAPGVTTTTEEIEAFLTAVDRIVTRRKRRGIR